MARSARLLAGGPLMLQDARPCSLENSDIFAQTPSIPSTRSGRDSAALKNGTATNGANDFPNTRTIVALGANGPQIIFSGAVGGSGSFLCRAAMSAPALFMTVAFSNFQKDQLWGNDCMRTF